jgi:hypothetical protein
MILQLRQILFTEAETFIVFSYCAADAGRHFNPKRCYLCATRSFNQP